MNEQNYEMNQEPIVQPKQKSGLATAGFVLGIVGICLSFIPILNFDAFIVAVVGVILSAVALSKKVVKPAKKSQ